MIIKDNISENLHNLLLEQYSNNNIFKTLGINAKKWSTFVNVIRPNIEEMGKRTFPMTSQSDPNYRITKDKEDAFCHQLASAIMTQMFGDKVSTLIGFANEAKGGLRIFLKGSPNQGIKKYSTINSGFHEDIGNNRIGVNIGKTMSNRNLQFYAKEVVKNIQNGNYYDNTGKLVGKSDSKEVT